MTSGIDLRYVDDSVRPQDDLFRHVNGRWLDEAEIPEDKARYSEFIRLREQAEKEVHAIIERVAASSPAPGTDEQKIADRSSRMDLIKNADGSVDIYMGPDAPEGKEANWIPTVPDKAWFPYFRLYSPKQAFMDRSWVLPDIEKAE